MSSPKEAVEYQERLAADVARETRRLRSDLDERSAELGELRQLLGFFQQVQGAKIAPPEWIRSPRSTGHHVLAVGQLTDTHFDEVVRPEEMLGLNAYNRRIAEMRLRRWVEELMTLVRDDMTPTGAVVDGCVILATGDILSGDIHAELKETNEAPLYASVVHWVELLIGSLLSLAHEFGSVHVAAVVGNHGRDSVKPVFKGRAHHNIEWLLWRVIAGRLADDSRITFDIPESSEHQVRLYDRTYVLDHGDNFKGGTGIAGALSPLLLGQHRKSVKHIAIGRPMDTLIVGHFHQKIDIPGLFMGGCMKGYDEFASIHNFRPSPALQMVWLETPEYGRTVTVPVFLQDREAEGW